MEPWKPGPTQHTRNPFRIRYKPPSGGFSAATCPSAEKRGDINLYHKTCAKDKSQWREWSGYWNNMFCFHFTSFCRLFGNSGLHFSFLQSFFYNFWQFVCFAFFSASNEHSIVWKPWKSSNDMLLVMERHQLDISTGDHCLSPSTPKFCLERFMANQHTPRILRGIFPSRFDCMAPGASEICRGFASWFEKC